MGGFEVEELLFDRGAEGEAADPVGCEDSMARNEERIGVAGARLADGLGIAGTDEGAVGLGCAKRDGANRLLEGGERLGEGR